MARRKIRLWMLWFSIVAALLAACGGDSGSVSSQKSALSAVASGAALGVPTTAVPPAGPADASTAAAGAGLPTAPSNPLVSRPVLDSKRDTSCADDVRGAAPGAPLAAATLAGVICRTLAVDGYPRQFLVYVPPRVQQPAPLVFMFHGSGGTGPQFLRISGWREMADESGLVAVFPTGLPYFVLEEQRVGTKWNDFSLAREVGLNRRAPGYPESAPWPADDVKFTRAMADDVRSIVPLDSSRLYPSGFSNGAAFVARLSVEASDIFAAAAAHTGFLGVEHAPKARIPRFITVGNEDDRLTEALGVKVLPMTLDGLRAIPQLGAAFNGELATWDLKDPPTTLTERPAVAVAQWAVPQPGNDDGNVFQFAVLRGLGHSYPNGRNNDAGFVAAKEYWRFFSEHPRR